MARGDGGASKILLCLALLVVANPSGHCASLTRLKALDRFRQSSTLSQGQTTGNGPRYGKLLIGQNSVQPAKREGAEATRNPLDVDSDYQADMGWGEPKQPTVWPDDFPGLNSDGAAVDRLLKMEPKVECTGDSMQLQVRNAASNLGSLFFVDRGSRLSPLPLSKLPPSCGYTIRSTRRDLILAAPYDGCFVAAEEDSYVLPLRWWGLMLRMSCPLMRPSSPNPPMVTCHAVGMVVKTEWTVSVAKIKVKLNGDWEPLMKASSSCGFSVVVHPEGVVISVQFAPCLEEKDGMYTLELTGDGETKISCPSRSPPEPKPTKHPDPKPQFPYQTLKPIKKPNGIDQSWWPYHFHPNLLYPYLAHPDAKLTSVHHIPTTAPATQTTTGRTHGPYLPFNFQLPQPGTPPKQSPVIKPPIKQTTRKPGGLEQKPSHPFIYPHPPPPPPKPHEKPVPTKPPFPEKPSGQIYHPLYPGQFYHGFLPYSPYRIPMPLKQQTGTPVGQYLPKPGAPQDPTIYMQPQQVARNGKATESASPHGGLVPPYFPNIPPVYCPQVCPSGFSNCCPQIAFHQYLHVVPPGPGGNRKPAEPMEAQVHTASTSAPSLQVQAHGLEQQYFQPLDGIAAASRATTSKPANPELPVYPYGPLHPYWPYLPRYEKLPQLQQSQMQTHNMPFKPRAAGDDAHNTQPLKQRNDQPSPEDINYLTELYSIPFFGQSQQQQQSNPTARDLMQSSNSQSSEPVVDLLVPNVEEIQGPPYDKTLDLDSLQPPSSVSTSKKITEGEQTFVLLQHGPPSGEPSSWYESPLPFRELAHDPSFLTHNLANDHNNKPPNLKFPQEPYQPLKWLENGMPNPLLGDGLGMLPLSFPASDSPHFALLSQDSTFNATNSKPKFPESLQDLWKPMTPLGPNRGVPPHVPERQFSHGAQRLNTK